MSVDETHVGFYNCVATNFKGRFYHAFEIKIKSLTIAGIECDYKYTMI